MGLIEPIKYIIFIGPLGLLKMRVDKNICLAKYFLNKKNIFRDLFK